MIQDQDTCRICSGPGEDEQPLFYPCKCSGTIRYIHQDCLKTWLDHSKKTTCDVCKHPYAFTKVYAPDMPDRVPVTILVRKFAEQVAAVVIFMLRATLVAFVWLTLLPYGTVLTWRLYFRMGDVLAWGISLHRRPDALNSTLQMVHNETPVSLSMLDASFQPYLRTLSTDIFTGQIIASLNVLIFLAVFLLREWIQQNALPGVFEDPPAGDVQGVPQAEPQPEPQPQDEDPIAPQVAEAPEDATDAESVPGILTPPVLDRPADSQPNPILDAPEEMRSVDPASSPASSSSLPSSDMENLPKRPAFARVTEQPLQPFGHRRRVKIHEFARRRAISAAKMDQNVMRRRRRLMGRDENPLDGQPWERAELPDGDMQDEYASVPRKRSGLHSLQRELGYVAKRIDLDLDTSSEPASTNQKRKADDSDSEQETRSCPVGSRPSSSPSSFEFTFHLPQSSRPQLSASHPTFALPTNGEFKLKLSSLSKASTSESTSSSRPGTRLKELPPPSEDHGGSGHLPYVLTPSTCAPSPSMQLAPERLEASSFQISPTIPTPSPPSQPLHHLPLPVTSVPTIEHTNAEASSSAVTTDSSVPVPSSDLAKCQSPVQLDVTDSEYFNDDHASLQDAQEEEDEVDDDDTRLEYYFRAPEPDGTTEMPPPLLLPETDDDDEEDDEAHDAEEVRDVEPQANVDGPPAAQDAPGPEAEAAELADEERDQNLEEDLDGAMEAVGLRGPVFAVFQNAALMLLILNVSIGGGIWIPFTLGKTSALLTLEPRRALQILHIPIRAVRLVTDPTVDGVVYVLRVVSSSIVELIGLLSVWILRSVDIVYGNAVQEALLHLFRRFDLRPIMTLSVQSGSKGKSPRQIDQEALWKMSGGQILTYTQSFILQDPRVASLTTSFIEGPIFQLMQENFADLGRRIRLYLTAAWKGWVDIVEGDGTVERLSAILLGYAIAAFFAALYLNTFTVGNVKSAGRAVRNAIRQQMIILKVALFIVVELVMFPFGCGIMLDFSTLSLFPEASVESRLAFFSYAPVTAAFYHWLIGTMFMYQFAILLATCREILRPGCMWFIKDPQDPTFHPIRDILDRPTLAQLRKLLISATMYAFVITLGLGSIVWSLTALTPSVLPLRWKMREPLWEVPVDLLFVHLILPPTLHHFRPRKTVRRLMTSWWQWAARQLRLTSFMFGDRHLHEEYTPTHWSWRTLFDNNEKQFFGLEAVRDGSFRRVPAGDNIAFVRDKPALIEVDENGIAVDEDSSAIIRAQNAEAQQAGRNYEDDYTVVYVPPHFRERVFGFILLFWLSGSVAMIVALFAPVLLGRAVFGLFLSRHVHDGYSFAAGFYLIWWGWLMGTLIATVHIRRQRHTGSKRVRASWFLFLSKRIFIYCTKVLWMGIWMGIVLPTLVSIAVDLYVVIPIRHFFNPKFIPTIHIVESWASGLILSKIIIRTQRTRPGVDLTGALEAIQRNGWRSPDPVAATRDFIIPVGTGLVGMIVIPPVILFGCHRFVTLPWPVKDLFRLVYPSIFVAVATFQFAMSLVGVFTKWTQGIRDTEFLVELRLRNLENPRKIGKVRMLEVEVVGNAEEESHKE